MNQLQHLKTTYPHLSHLLNEVPPLQAIRAQHIPIPEAVTKIVIGQMLSRTAADTIYSRVMDSCNRHKFAGSWQLPEKELLACGLSQRKARTIREFSDFYTRSAEEVEAWRDLNHKQLREAVSEHWGLSKWSADMLAIFYFAMPDVFPESDGSIIRVRQVLEQHHIKGKLNPQDAKPYRTSLTRYMWAFLDNGILQIEK